MRYSGTAGDHDNERQLNSTVCTLSRRVFKFAQGKNKINPRTVVVRCERVCVCVCCCCATLFCFATTYSAIAASPLPSSSDTEGFLFGTQE